MRGDRAEVGAERGEVDRDVTRGRARVDVHERAALAQRRAHLGRRLHGADFVVRELHADERGVGAHRVDDRGRVEPPEPIDADHGHVGRAARDRVAHARVLDRGRHDVPGAARANAPATAVFTASVPDDVNTTSRGRAPKNARDLLARVLQRDPRRAPLGVQPSRVAERRFEERAASRRAPRRAAATVEA